MKKVVFAICSAATAFACQAQESLTDYNFLRLPVSAHVAALGGDNITIIEDDPSLIFHNPALISCVSDRSINLNFMTYMEGTKTAGASFVKALNQRATWGVSAKYMDYGTMKEVNEDNVETGTFSAKDIMIGGTFAYTLTDKIAGGVTTKIIYSSIAGYSSIAMGIDLGLNYYDEENDISVSAVARNLGGQVKAFNDDFERIPLDLQLGVSKKLGNAPLRLSGTMTGLNDWHGRFANHFVIGADILLSSSIYVSGGYNFRRVDEMKISDTENESSHGAGLSFGGGIQLERFKLQVGYAKYHVSASSLIINATYTL
ncbi:type IX secretion system protein PorQ [Xylanibacter muris]|uniref:Type IX secretion system protein PorQ n=1 Tax=Xylanibacter muris TaxID=2736290 RepID=A0ABX2ATA7_9BACT|nr:type IX secretion system protein PorQ [Xylanibacter muris]NPD93191.1 type IX secretion system protein PorQ [Xylanibacter muris]